MSKQYKDAGVNLEAGYESVELIKKHIDRTKQFGLMNQIGSFGGMFDLSVLNYKEPVLVSGTDGVGTKLKLALAMDKHDTIGQDVVAMCVNDVLAQGAKPLFFLDYIATGKNIPARIEQIVKGVADGCCLAQCALVGGETAEMPDMYSDDDYDIAGFTVGAVEKSRIITGEKTKIGDVVIGLASSGVHSNGFSLIRKIVMKDKQFDLQQKYGSMNKPLGETLLEPTKIYVSAISSIIEEIDIHGIANITGGGFFENMPRCLNDGLGISIMQGSWKIPEVFTFLAQQGNIAEMEMYNVFNMGIGMIVVVDNNDVDKTMELLQKNGDECYVIGEVISCVGVSFE